MAELFEASICYTTITLVEWVWTLLLSVRNVKSEISKWMGVVRFLFNDSQIRFSQIRFLMICHKNMVITHLDRPILITYEDGRSSQTLLPQKVIISSS